MLNVKTEWNSLNLKVEARREGREKVDTENTYNPTRSSCSPAPCRLEVKGRDPPAHLWGEWRQSAGSQGVGAAPKPGAYAFQN
jgi:hypothetical protein